MRQLLTLCSALSLSVGAAVAQSPLSLGEEWLIDENFSLDLAIDDTYRSTANIGAGGSDQSWIFANLTSQDTVELRTRPASEGMLADTFPTADFIFTAGIDVGILLAGSEIYMNRQDDDVFIVGIGDPVRSDALPFIALDQPLAFQSSPLEYRQVGDASSVLNRVLSAQFVADATGFALAATLFDSIRVSVEESITYEVDAWGSLILGDDTFNSLRLRSEIETKQFVEGKDKRSGRYIDITALVPAEVFGTLGTNAQVDYSWVVAEYSYPLVQVTLDEAGTPNELRYGVVVDTSGNDGSSATTNLANAGLTMQATARPGTLELSLEGGAAGASGTLVVYGIDARVLVQRDNINLEDSRLSLDTSNWPAGVQLVTLFSNGRPVATQRIATY